MRTRVVAVAAVALMGLLGGCSGGTEPSPAGTASQQSPAAPPPAASSQSSAPASPSPSESASSEAPTSNGRKVTTADGALSWTMPCKPDKDNITGNEEDKKTYRSYQGWSCGKRGAATSGVFVVELVKKPADEEAARTAMRTALQDVVPNSKPADNDLAGTPGIAGTTELNRKKFGYQVISFGSYLAVFLATPVKDLDAITESVQVS